jgi:hypothetical protein
MAVEDAVVLSVPAGMSCITHRVAVDLPFVFLAQQQI